MTSIAGSAEDPTLTPARTQAEPVERTSPLAVLAWMGFALLFLYIVLLGGSWLGIYAVGLRALSLLLTAVGLAVWLLVAWRAPDWRPSTAIWPAIALPALTLTVSALASMFPRVGLEYAAWAVLVTALYLLLARIMRLSGVRARIGGLAAATALVLGFAYVGWVLLLWVEWWSLIGEVIPPPLRPLYLGLTWGNPSAVLTVQVLLLLISAAGLGFRTRGARLTLTVLGVLSVLVIIMSGSRAGWIAVAGALVIVGGAWLAHEVWLHEARRRELGRLLAARRVRVALALGVVVAVALAVVFAPTIIARFEGGGDGGRPVYFAVALRMFAESPILGLGPGTWAARRVAYTDAGELDFVIPHAHNIYLHTAAELGIVGLAVGTIALVCVGWLAIGAIRGGDPVRARWGWATVAALVYLGLHELFDYYANMPAVFFLAGIPVAVLDATAQRRLGLPVSLERFARPLRGLATIALVIGCAVAVVFLGRSELVARTHQVAVAAINDAEWTSALEPAADAVRSDPGIAPYQQALAQAAFGVGDHRTAAAAYLAAAELDDLPSSWLGLALSQERLGEPDDRVAASLDRAMRLGVQQPTIAFIAGQVYDRVGRPDAARDAYVVALAGMPELAGAAWWVEDEARSARFGEILDATIQEHPQLGWELALMTGDADRARSLLGDDEATELRRLVIDAWMGDAEAIAGVRSYADAHVNDATALAWAARVTAHAGDEDASARYHRLVDIGRRGGDQGVEVEVGSRVATRDAALGTNSFNYGNYMHRRTSPMDLIVPGVPAPIIAERGD